MALTLTFNQLGLPAGATDRGRTDILADGTPVTITVGNIPDGSLIELTILDEPPSSNPHLSSSSPASWTLTFDAACWGPFRIRATATIGQDVVSSVTRRISIRSPLLNIDYPALSERTDPNATLVPTVPSVQLTEMNEGETNRPLVNFYRQLLKALEDNAASGGDGGGAATALRTTGAPVNVASAPPPVAGLVLTATGLTAAVWKVPGLRYDPAIKTWSSTTGTATIEPGTWGLVDTDPPDATEIVVDIVSSFEAPPVDSRFGLYVGRNVTLPVRVAVIGASQIMGVDGVLDTTVPLPNGAAYEWILYHDGTDAIWGLVSDTAGVAKRIGVAGAILDIVGDAPSPGQALLATEDGRLAFGDVAASGGGSGLMPHPGLSGDPAPGEYVVADGSAVVLLPNTTTIGARVGVFAFADSEVQPPDGHGLFFGAAAITGPETLPLPAGAYAEWSLVDFGEATFAWIPAGASNETAADGGDGGTGDLAYIGGSSFPSAGQWCMVDSADVTLPDDAPLGGTVGMFVTPNRDGATLHLPPAHDLAFGNLLINPGGTLTLRGGAYYEWTLESVGESTRWLPRRMSSEHPEPLTFTANTTDPMPPNTWARATSSDVVHSPSSPQDGDSFAVLVTDNTTSVAIQNGQSLLSHDALTQIEWPDTLSVTGPDYFEWVWSANLSTWLPRKSTTMQPPASMLASGAIISLANDDTPAVGQVLSLVAPGQAAWRYTAPLTYDDSTPTQPNTWVLSSAYSDAVTMPLGAANGDVFAIYVDGDTCVVTSGEMGLLSPNGEEIVFNDDITLAGPNYCEWFYIAADNRWYPRQNVLSLRADAVAAAIREDETTDELDVGTKRIINVLDPVGMQDAATKAYALAAAAAAAAGAPGTSYAAGAGLTLTGTTFAVVAHADGSIVADPDDIKVGVLATDAQHGTRGGGTLHALASDTVAGFLAAADFTKIANVPTIWRTPCMVATTTNVVLSGTQTIDGYPTVAGTRVLVWQQTLGKDNGPYVVAAGAWTRATDVDTSAELQLGMTVPILFGTLYAGVDFVLTTVPPYTLGTQVLTFTPKPALAFALKSGGAIITSPATQPSSGQVLSNNGAGVLTWTTLAEPSTNGYRLTPDNTDSVLTDASFSVLYAVPIRSNQICIWNGAAWQVYTASGTPSYTLAGRTAGLPFDVFAAPNVTTFALEVVNWASASARSQALAKKDGVWVKGSDLTRRYVGTVLPDSATTFAMQRNQGVAGGSAPTWGVWNADNRRPVTLRAADATTSWAYSTATWRQANAPAADLARAQCVIGLALDSISLELDAYAANDTAGTQLGVALGSITTAPLVDSSVGLVTVPTANAVVGLRARHSEIPAIGVRNFYWLEKGAASGVSTFYGAATDKQSQMLLTLLA